jgi:thiol-disulfide isomerase/thioredoxin
MRKSIVLLHLVTLIVLLNNTCLKAQNKPLTVGDEVPDLTFKNTFNSSNAAIKLSDLRGKLVILDFWGVFCIPCIEEFPKLDSLQRMFSSEIQIIPVNPLDRDSIGRFFKNHPKVYLPSLPFITGDTILQKVFPHQGNPYIVWIGKDGKMLLDDVPVTQSNIEAVLSNKTMKVPEAVKNNYVESLFDKRWSDDMVYSSYIYKGTDLGLKLEKSKIGQSFSEGGTVMFLYQRAWEGLTSGKYGFFRPGRTVIQTKDSSRYIKPKNLHGYDEQVWLRDNIYWYQSSIPNDKQYNPYELMKEDLNRAFHLNAGIEKRPVRCLALVRTSNINKIKTLGHKPVDSFFHADRIGKDYGSTRSLINQPFSKFSKRLTGLIEYGLKQPFIDQTGYTGNIDIQFEADVLDGIALGNLRKALKVYDLDLVEKDVDLTVLSLKEN